MAAHASRATRATCVSRAACAPPVSCTCSASWFALRTFARPTTHPACALPARHTYLARSITHPASAARTPCALQRAARAPCALQRAARHACPVRQFLQNCDSFMMMSLCALNSFRMAFCLALSNKKVVFYSNVILICFER